MSSSVGAAFLAYMNSSNSSAKLKLILDQESQAAPQLNFSPETEDPSCLRNVRAAVSDIAFSCLEMNWSDISPARQVCQNRGEPVDRRSTPRANIECFTVTLFAL
jgi:hypothetical protein